jgi:glucan biosynthesis protein
MEVRVTHMKWQKDEVSEMLGTGYHRFVSEAGVHGLAKIVGVSDLHILAVSAMNPGSGQFRDFIVRCKAEAQTIWVWEIWAEELVPVLGRYGFVACVGEERGEKLTGMRWSRS